MKNEAYVNADDDKSLNHKIEQLQEEVRGLRSTRAVPLNMMDVEGSGKKEHGRNLRQVLNSVLLWISFICIVIIGITLIGLYFVNKKEPNDANSDPASSGLSVAALAQDSQLSPENDMKAPFYHKQYINMGERSDDDLQECQGPELKKSFPDLDYAFMGYNILKGYPLAIGHDPGFSLPIFTADYSKSGQTNDCRYSVPRGFVVTPDVSCLLSFSSKLIQTRYEYSKTLSASASVSGETWPGVEFSASVEYKMTSSALSMGYYSYILSTASCMYYYSRIIPNMPPPLHPAFVDWVKRLNAATDDADDLYAQFFDTYGTHYAPEVTFGARYTEENKIKSKTLDEMSDRGVNVAISAEYSGIFSVGGEFNLDIGQQKEAMDFRKSVETKRITVGAPPSSTGGAEEWASSVRSDPAPVALKLASIEELFTSYFMKGLGVNYNRIANNIKKHKGIYCKYMMQKGEVFSCTDLLPGLGLRNTRLLNDYKAIEADKPTCMDTCDADVSCVAISKCVSCQNDFYKKLCYLFKEGKQELKSNATAGWESTIFVPKIQAKLVLRDTNVIGTQRDPTGTEPEKSIDGCLKRCTMDEQCVAFSSTSSGNTRSCRLYAQRAIIGLEKRNGTTTWFISHQKKSPPVSL